VYCVIKRTGVGLVYCYIKDRSRPGVLLEREEE
jgi:hypothetical protein